ncbi:MAG: GNAT family N-acetyltransferase [bacterium]
MSATTVARIEAWDAAAFDARVRDVMEIYVAAMGYPASAANQRGRAAHGQATFPGFTARGAYDATGRLVGFCYGYRSEQGQWWHELVRKAVDEPTADEWLVDAFELSEFHVRPDAQARGIGRSLLVSLADGLPHRTMMLSTPDADTRAMRLYRRFGFQDLARDHFFPGEARPFAILGRCLPLDAAP